MYDSELISIKMLIDWQIWKKRAFFANQNHPNGLFTCKMFNSYLLQANTLKNMNTDLNLAILLNLVANFRHQFLNVCNQELITVSTFFNPLTKSTNFIITTYVIPKIFTIVRFNFNTIFRIIPVIRLICTPVLESRGYKFMIAVINKMTCIWRCVRFCLIIDWWPICCLGLPRVALFLTDCRLKCM